MHDDRITCPECRQALVLGQVMAGRIDQHAVIRTDTGCWQACSTAGRRANGGRAWRCQTCGGRSSCPGWDFAEARAPLPGEQVPDGWALIETPKTQAVRMELHFGTRGERTEHGTFLFFVRVDWR